MHSRLVLDDDLDTEEAYRRINEIIRQHQVVVDEHQASIVTLRSQYNELAHISRLPPELLCQIFLFAQRDRLGRMLPYPRWTKLTHVSSHWRSVAINSPSLWTEPDLADSPWLEEAIRRSQSAGLVINITQLVSRHLWEVKFAMKYSSRIRGLRIRDNGYSRLWYPLQNLLPESFPRLEFLHLEDVDSRMPSPMPIAKDVLQNMPRLRALRLDRCNIDWSSHLFQRILTHLTIQISFPTPRPKGSRFFRIMKELPKLQYLDLVDVLPVIEQTTWPPNQIDPIHFPHLRTLSICDSMPLYVGPFFQLVTFHPDALVRIKCYPDQQTISSANYSGIIMGIAKSYSVKASGSHCFQTLFLAHTELYRISVSLQFRLFKRTFSNEEMTRYAFQKVNADFALDFVKRPSNYPLLSSHDFLNHVFNGSIPLQDIRNVYLDGADLSGHNNAYDPALLVQTFGSLPQLQSVVVGKYSSRTLVDALNLGLDSKDRLCFPKLSSICFVEVRITTLKSAPNPIAVPVELLQSYLVRRYKSGAEIRSVTFRQPCQQLGLLRTVDMLEEMVFDAVRDAKKAELEDIEVLVQ